jgi:adenosine deaminase
MPALATADMHVHQEQSPRLDRVLARRAGRAPFDWRPWARSLAGVPPGLPRLRELSSLFPGPLEADDDETFVERVEDLLDEAGRAGAVLVEVRYGKETLLRPGFMDLVREAERRVRERNPDLHHEAVAIFPMSLPPERLAPMVDATLRAAGDGLRAIDLIPDPYDAEADWRESACICQRAADAGLGITIHAGEFSTANIAAAAQMPGLTRLGHAVHATDDPRLVELLLEREIVVEVCLTCNVALGAVASLEEHPIRGLHEAGVPVVLGTDNPVQIETTIAREYELAAGLGLDPHELTRAAIAAAFTTDERRAALSALT